MKKKNKITIQIYLMSFFESEKSTGLILIACPYFLCLYGKHNLWDAIPSHLAYEVGRRSLEYWINDGLMTIFFY
jgi:NhaA family Na+:H+ antiporter